MKRILLFSFLLPSFFSFGQITFHKIIGGSQDDMAAAVQQTADSGFIIVGNTKTFSAGNNDVYAIKTNAYGDILWTRVYGGTDNDLGTAVQQTADKGYIICGHTASFGAGDLDVFIIRTDSIGDTVWTKTFGGSIMDFSYGVCELADGGFIIAGETRSFGAGLGDIYLIKLNSAGDSLWTRTYGGPAADWATAIAACFDGGYIIAGATGSYGAGDSDDYLIRTDSAGNVLWSKTYGGIYKEASASVAQTPDSGFIVSGITFSFGAGATDIYLVKTNSAGDTLWTRTYGGSSYDYGNSVQPTADGCYIIAGYTQSFLPVGNNVYLIKVDSSGSILWSRSYGGPGSDLGYGVQQTTDGGYVIAAQTTSYGSGLYDVYLIKENSVGASGCNEESPATIRRFPATITTYASTIVSAPPTVVGNASVTISGGGIINTLCTSVDIAEENNYLQSEVSVFPNPFSNQLNVKCNSPAFISLCDYTGKEILHQKINSGEGIINKVDLAAGLYFLKVENGVGVRNFKVVKGD